MKEYIILILVMLFSLYIGIKVERLTNKPEKVLDLPEEWKEAKQGDTLKVYKVTKDSIYIQFYNYNNK